MSPALQHILAIHALQWLLLLLNKAELATMQRFIMTISDLISYAIFYFEFLFLLLLLLFSLVFGAQ